VAVSDSIRGYFPAAPPGTLCRSSGLWRGVSIKEAAAKFEFLGEGRMIVSQGLKPVTQLAGLTARLKPCPFASCLMTHFQLALLLCAFKTDSISSGAEAPRFAEPFWHD
jgi:hypothetical protein